MTTEEWKDVVGFPDYRVSTLGRMLSKERKDRRGRWRKERILRPKTIWNGYKTVRLLNDDEDKAVLVHRAVAIAFIPNPAELPEVDHINNDRTDNCVANLQWIARQHNRQKIHLAKGKTGAKGVTFQNGKFVARIGLDKKLIVIGSFANLIDAANAYDLMATKLFGVFAVTNKQIRERNGHSASD